MTENTGLRKEVVTPNGDWSGRDAGKQYLITEMVASKAEWWGWRMMTLARKSKTTIPIGTGLQMVDVAVLGLNLWLDADVEPDRLHPLLDELMQCVQIVRNPGRPDIASPLVSENDVQEVAVRLWLKSEVIRVHTGFSPAEALSRLISAIQVNTENSSTTPTSRPPSE